MAKKPLPDTALLLKLLRYDAETGKLYWRARTPDMFDTPLRDEDWECSRWNSRHAGEEAFVSRDTGGYARGYLLGSTYAAHRVIYAMVTGEAPEEIDHINGDRTDNRMQNLRPVTRAQNNRNARRRHSNRSGVTGVSRTREGRWRAEIQVDRVRHILGAYDCFAQAVRARHAANRQFGFAPGHGRD